MDPDTKKIRVIEKIQKLELEIAHLKKILLDFINDYNNNQQQKIEDYNGFLLKEEIQKLQKKKYWLWDY